MPAALSSLLHAIAVWLGAQTSFLDPAGPVAYANRSALLATIFAMSFVVVPIFTVTPWFAWHYRRRNDTAPYRPRWGFSWPLEFFVWAGPIVIVGFLAVGAWVSTHALDPYRPVWTNAPPLEVQVVMLDWKFLFLYPQQGIATTNLLVVPVGRDVHLSLTSGSVLQSFLIPRLAGQIYAMPGMRTQLHFLASRSGRFVGMNTQYNGAGFARQRFYTVAIAPPAFARWAVAARTHGPALNQARYAALARPSLAGPGVYGSAPAALFATIIAGYGSHSAMPMAGMAAPAPSPTAKSNPMAVPR